MHTVLDSWVLFPGPHHAAVWTLQLLAYLCKDGTQVCLYLLTVALGHSREIITSRRKGCSQKSFIWPAGSQELPWACVLGLLLTSLQLGRPQPSLAIGAGDQWRLDRQQMQGHLGGRGAGGPVRNTRWGKLWQTTGPVWAEHWFDLIVPDRASRQLQGEPFRGNSPGSNRWHRQQLVWGSWQAHTCSLLLLLCPTPSPGRSWDVSLSCLLLWFSSHWVHFIKANSLWAIWF